EMLAGRRAFPGQTTTDSVAAILEREPDWAALPPSTPPHVVRLLRRCLDKDPKRRLRDIADARADLDDGDKAPVGVPANRRPGRLRGAALLVATTAIVTAAGVGTFLRWFGRGDRSYASMAQTIASRLTNYAGIEADGVISPDGRSFIFVSDHAGTPDIWLRQLSGGDPVRLTDDAALESNLAYTADGDAIYFARADADGVAIWRMGALGGQRQKVLSGLSAGGGPTIMAGAPQVFSLSPDGRRLAFYEHGVLVLSAIDGTGHQRVASGVLPSAGRPAWSPNGRFVSFVRGGLFAPNNVFVVDLVSGRERQVTRFARSIEGVYSQSW